MMLSALLLWISPALAAEQIEHHVRVTNEARTPIVVEVVNLGRENRSTGERAPVDEPCGGLIAPGEAMDCVIHPTRGGRYEIRQKLQGDWTTISVRSLPTKTKTFKALEWSPSSSPEQHTSRASPVVPLDPPEIQRSLETIGRDLSLAPGLDPVSLDQAANLIGLVVVAVVDEDGQALKIVNTRPVVLPRPFPRDPGGSVDAYAQRILVASGAASEAAARQWPMMQDILESASERGAAQVDVYALAFAHRDTTPDPEVARLLLPGDRGALLASLAEPNTRAFLVDGVRAVTDVSIAMRQASPVPWDGHVDFAVAEAAYSFVDERMTESSSPDAIVRLTWRQLGDRAAMTKLIRESGAGSTALASTPSFDVPPPVARELAGAP